MAPRPPPALGLYAPASVRSSAAARWPWRPRWPRRPCSRSARGSTRRTSRSCSCSRCWPRARAGRTAGFLAAAAGFLAFDVWYLPPYGTLAVADPLDWLVLGAFLAVSATATALLDRARREARDARARAAEVDRIAALGARALTTGRADDALAAVADAVRATLALDGCEAWAVGDAVEAQRRGLPTTALLAAESRATVAERRDGTVRVGGAPSGAPGAEPSLGTAGPPGAIRRALGAPPAEVAAVSVPLVVRDGSAARLVGVLRLARADGLDAPDAAWRALDALAYYAALAADRARLAGADERAAVLAEAGRLKDALLAAVSHDLRTPLTTIKAHAQGLRLAPNGSVPAEDAGERLVAIEQEADRLTRLVSDLLDLSRLHGGAMPLAPEVAAADDLLDVVLQRVEGALGDPAAGGRAVRVTLPEGAPLLVGRFDVAASARVLVNLVENAHKYAPPNTPVDLALAADPDRLRFTVADRGPGVAPAERERIFEPFYRVPGAAAAPVDGRGPGGVGLGLAIAREMAAAQGGTLAYAARAGGGAEFTLTLPRVRLDD